MIKYMSKSQLDISASAPVLIDAAKHIKAQTLLDAAKHIKEHPSTAADSGERDRDAKHFLQHILNRPSVEMEGTQAASLVLGQDAHYFSDRLEYHYGWDFACAGELAAEHKPCTIAAVESESESKSEESGGEDEDDGEGEGDDNDDAEDDVYDNCEDGAENDGEDDGFMRLQEAEGAGLAPVDLPHRGDALPPVESDLLSKLSAGAGSKDSASCVYTLPAGAGGEDGGKVPVWDATHYAYRAPELADLNAVEYGLAFVVQRWEKMTPSDKEWLAWALKADEARRTRDVAEAAVIAAERMVAEAAGEGRDQLLQAAVTVATKAKAELEAVRAQEPKGGNRKPVHRFLFQEPHPLRKNHFAKLRQKWGVPALCGANPPEEPKNTRTRQGKRDARAYARYYVANYVPWSAAEPPSLDYASWTEVKRGWVADADPVPPQGDSTELTAGGLDREERRAVAVGRLFMVENASDGFRADTKAVILGGKYRMRQSTRWRTDEDGNDNRPGGSCTGDEANDADRQGARDIEELRRKNRRLHGQGDIKKRTQKVVETRARMRTLSDLLPSRYLAPAAAGAGAVHAGPKLQELWASAVPELWRGPRRPAELVEAANNALVANVPPRPPLPRAAAASAAAWDAVGSWATAWDACNAVGHALGGHPPPPALPELSAVFVPFSAGSAGEDEFKAAANAYTADAVAYKAAEEELAAARDQPTDSATFKQQLEEALGRPPLNPEQRRAGGEFLQVCRVRAAVRACGASAAAADAAIKAAGLSPVMRVDGPGGVGKTLVVHEVKRELEACGAGYLLVTAQTGPRQRAQPLVSSWPTGTPPAPAHVRPLPQPLFPQVSPPHPTAGRPCRASCPWEGPSSPGTSCRRSPRQRRSSGARGSRRIAGCASRISRGSSSVRGLSPVCQAPTSASADTDV
jgi:hypothetical protein